MSEIVETPVGNDPRIGTTIAGYRVERLLGRGGMGTVYLAEDLALQRKVALKLLSVEFSDSEAFRERIQIESRLAASIDHPNVIPIYDAGQAGDGALFIAMRYVEGADLKRILRAEGALEPQRAVDVLAQIAKGLDAAHARGLIHRDVKPSNVLVAQADDGAEHVYLADFGLTQTATSSEAARESITLSGSSDYVSPEQIRGTGSDRSSDLYALGCVAYECLTGEVPYPRHAEMEVLVAHMNEQPPRPSGVNPALPSGLDAVTAKAMAKEPERRYASGTELVEAIRRETTPRRRLSKRAGALLLGLLAVIVAAAVVPAVLLTGGADERAALAPPDPDTSTVETIAGTRMAGFSGDGGPAVQAELNDPGEMAFDAMGNLYFTDFGNDRIRKIDPSGVITTIAGTGGPGPSGDGGPAAEAALVSPITPSVDAAGNLYFAEFSFGTVRKIDSDGVITTVAGAGGIPSRTASNDSGLALEADLSQPWTAVDPDGVIYISDPNHHRILRVDQDGTYTTFAGTGTPGFSGDGGPATDAEFSSPTSITAGPDGSVYFFDEGNSRIRRVDPNGVITTVAGNGVQGFSGDGVPAIAASLADVWNITLDSQENLYFGDSEFGTNFGNRVRRVNTAGIIRTVAGKGTPGFSGDGGPATEAEFNRPLGVALDPEGNVYIADSRNNRIRKVTFNP